MFIQSCRKYLGTFSRFSTIFLPKSEAELDCYHQKVSLRIASRVAERLKTSTKFFKCPNLMVSTQTDTQELNFDVFVKNPHKTSCKTFDTEIYFAQYREYVCNLLSRIVWKNRVSFLTQYTPLDFKFSENFRISKDPFAFEINIQGSKDLKTIYFKKHYFAF